MELAKPLFRQRGDLVMDFQDRIVADPNILSGKPVVKGTRLSVEFIVGLLAQGWSETEITKNYPGLTRDDVRACLEYSAGRNKPKSGPHTRGVD
jgi:uncharacterized protein (DUF433 family)